MPLRFQPFWPLHGEGDSAADFLILSLNCPNDDAHGVSLTLDEDSVWNVTETSYLRGLVIKEGTAVIGASLFINGQHTDLLPGTYSGQITLKV